MESIIIDVHQGRYQSAKAARRDGQIPMICYAKEMEPIQYTVDYQTFRRAFLKAGRSAIITLNVDGKGDQDVLVHEMQYDPVSDNITHVDLMAIKKGQKINTEIPLVFVGESPAVKEQGGVFNSAKDKVAIECLPKDLVHEIEVDISSLVDFHTSLTVGDIKVPSTITITDAPEISIATVAAAREEEEEVPVVAAEGETEGEAATEGEKKEGDDEGKKEA